MANTLIHVIDGYVKKIDKGCFKNYVSAYSSDVKEKLLAYMRKFKADAFTSAPVVDIITGERIREGNNRRTDGKYAWLEDEIYHLDKYNLQLNNDFIEYVLKHS